MAQGLSLYSPSDWDQIRACFASGMTDKEICADFPPLKRASLRKRRCEDNKKGDPWLGPVHYKRIAEEQKMKAKLNGLGNGTLDLPTTAEESIAAKLLRDGELSSVHAMKILLKKLTIAAMDPDSIKDLEDVSDVALSAKAARNIAGLDKPDVGVVLNLAAAFPS